MEKTPHNFLGFDGAKKFIKQQGFELVDPNSLISDYAREALDDWTNTQKTGGILRFAKTEIGHRKDEVLSRD